MRAALDAIPLVNAEGIGDQGRDATARALLDQCH
jgi:hypothetical protein